MIRSAHAPARMFASVAIAALAGCGQPATEPPLHASYSGSAIIDASHPAHVELHSDGQTAWLIEAQQREIDVWIEILDENGRTLSATDSPSRRSGTERALMLPPRGGRYQLMVHSAEHPRKAAKVSITVYPVEEADQRTYATWLKAERLETQAAAASRSGAAGSAASALNAYRNAAASWSRQHLPVRAAMAQLRAAWVYHRLLSDPASAATSAQRAAAIFSRAGEARFVAESLLLSAIALSEASGAGQRDLASAQTARSRRIIARDQASRARTVFERLGDEYGIAEAIHALAGIDYYGGNFARAKALFNEAESRYRRLNEPEGIRKATANAAYMDYQLGRFREAIAAYDRVFAADSPRSNPGMYADMLDNSAHARTIIGEFEAGLKQYVLALDLHTQMQDLGGQGRSLHGIGATYQRMGNPRRAVGYLEQAIVVRRQTKNAAELVSSLLALASAYQGLGRSRDAHACLEEALQMATTRIQKHAVQLARARQHEADLDYASARTLLQEIIADVSDDNAAIAARARLELGRVETELHNYAGAIETLQRARATFNQQGAPIQEAQALYSGARAYRRQGKPAVALERVRAAIAIAERVRAAATNPDFRARFLSARRAMYDLQVNLLLDEYQTSKDGPARRRLLRSALIASDLSRSRSLSDIIAVRSAPADHGNSAAQMRRLSADIASREYQLDALRDHDPNSPSIDAIRREIVDLRARYDLASGSLPSHQSPGLLSRAALTTDTVAADVCVLVYFVSQERSFVWRVTGNSVQGYFLPAGPALSAAVMKLRRHLLQVAPTDLPAYVRALTAASESLLPQPLANVPQGSWIVVPDGPVHYAPFAALLLPEEHASGARRLPAIARHDIRIATTYAAALRAARDASPVTITATRPAVIIGDPVLSRADARLPTLHPTRGESGPPRLPRLSGASLEIGQISKLLQATKPLVITGSDATRGAVLPALALEASVLHFATHASFDPRNPDRSGVQLSLIDSNGHRTDGLLTAADLAGTTVHADLVVLSACESALGEALDAEGLVGLSYAFLAAGARAVISTQWRVSDAAMAVLMERFYANMAVGALPPHKALRGAQMELMNGGRWKHPAFWAAASVTVAR